MSVWKIQLRQRRHFRQLTAAVGASQWGGIVYRRCTKKNKKRKMYSDFFRRGSGDRPIGTRRTCTTTFKKKKRTSSANRYFHATFSCRLPFVSCLLFRCVVVFAVVGKEFWERKLKRKKGRDVEKRSTSSSDEWMHNFSAIKNFDFSIESPCCRYISCFLFTSSYLFDFLQLFLDVLFWFFCWETLATGKRKWCGINVGEIPPLLRLLIWAIEGPISNNADAVQRWNGNGSRLRRYCRRDLEHRGKGTWGNCRVFMWSPISFHEEKKERSFKV